MHVFSGFCHGTCAGDKQRGLQRLWRRDHSETVDFVSGTRVGNSSRNGANSGKRYSSRTSAKCPSGMQLLLQLLSWLRCCCLNCMLALWNELANLGLLLVYARAVAAYGVLWCVYEAAFRVFQAVRAWPDMSNSIICDMQLKARCTRS